MTNKKIRIGILGCANIANRSMIPAIKKLDNIYELSAIASRTTEKAKQVAQEFQIPLSLNYQDLLDHPEIDALYIPLPTGLHHEWVNKALCAGKHVYGEKSLASSYTEALEMVTIAKKNDVCLMEGYMFLYHSQHSIIKKMLEDNAIGEVRHFSSSFGFPPLPPKNFRYDDIIGGGSLLDAAGYTIRATHFMMGNDFEVQGATLFIDPKYNTNIYGSAFLTNRKGIGASVAFGFDNFYQCKYEIWGSTGKIIAERAFTPKFDYSPKIIVENNQGTNVINASPDNHFVNAMLEFSTAIKSKETKEKHYSEILLQSKSLDQIKLKCKQSHE